MAASIDVKYTLGFSDDTTQDVTIGPFDTATFNTDVGQTLKSRVMEFNANFTSDTARMAVSKYGNPWTGIVKVQIIQTNKTVYY